MCPFINTYRIHTENPSTGFLIFIQTSRFDQQSQSGSLSYYCFSWKRDQIIRTEILFFICLPKIIPHIKTAQLSRKFSPNVLLCICVPRCLQPWRTDNGTSSLGPGERVRDADGNQSRPRPPEAVQLCVHPQWQSTSGQWPLSDIYITRNLRFTNTQHHIVTSDLPPR